MASFAALMIVFASVTGLYALSGFFDEKEEAIASEETAAVPEEPEEEKMLLGVFEGKLALFIGESPYPNEIYDFLTRTLPSQDQKRLAEGIEISSEEELRALLEDYMS